MKVKWNGHTSKVKDMNGDGAQGGLPGILEYLSQNNDCADFLKEDERYKFIDDLSILEIINLISLGISSYNCKQGSVQVLYKHVWGGGGSDQKCLFAYGVRGGWGVLRQNAYITDLNSYSPEKGL